VDKATFFRSFGLGSDYFVLAFHKTKRRFCSSRESGSIGCLIFVGASDYNVRNGFLS
jgi:hypothetical protein